MSKFVWVQKAKGNEAHTWLGSQGQVKRLFSTCWCREAEGNVPQQVFEKPGWGKGKRGTYLVGLSRPSEMTLLYTLVPWSWGKWTQQVFEKPGWVKVNPGQILFGSLKSRIQFLGLEGGLSDEEVSGGPGQGKRIIHMLVSWGWAKRTPIIFEKAGWGKVNTSQILFGPEGRGKQVPYFLRFSSLRPRETNPIAMLVTRGWGKQTQQVFEKPGWVKVNPGQNLFGSTRHIFG